MGNFNMGKKAVNQRKQRNQNKQKLVHPNSRKASKLNNKTEKKIKNNFQENQRDKKYKCITDKYIWFGNRAPEKPISHSELAELAKEYIQRCSDAKDLLLEETEQHLQLKRKVRASLNSKHDLFEFGSMVENNKFKGTGFEVPDFLTKSGLNSLLEWDESVQNLPQVKTVLAKESWLKEDVDGEDNNGA